MKAYENQVAELWEFMEKSTVVTINDFNKTKEEMGKIMIKIQMQREELEQSRDNWKKKYMELKKE